MPKRAIRFRIAVGVIVVVLISLLRFALLRSLDDEGFFTKYLVFADSILAGNIPHDRLGDLSAGYLWLMVVLRWFGLGRDGILFVQSVFVTLAAVCVALTAHKIRGTIAAISAFVLVLGSQAAFLNASDFEPETLILLLNAAAFFFILNGDRARSANVWRESLGGLALGLSVVTRPTAILLVAVIFVWLMWRRRDVVWPESAARGRQLRSSLPIAFLAGALLPIAAVAAVNARLGAVGTIMDPGTVFYEGMNPLASGYSGVQPRIVGDLEPAFEGPDTLHVTYRIVASRALGRTLNRDESNRYWIGKSLAFAREYPFVAARLVLKKAYLSFHAYDAYDLAPMELKRRELRGYLWLSPALLFAFALGAAIPERLRDMSGVLFALLVMSALPMTVFYVTARQRNAVLPAAAILAATGVARLTRLLQEKKRKQLAGVTLAIVVLSLGLSVRTAEQREDRFAWSTFFEFRKALAAAERASAAGDLQSARFLRATAFTRRPDVPIQTRRDDVIAVAVADLKRGVEVPRLFSLALSLADFGVWDLSHSILSSLQAEGYKPWRRANAVSSVAYHLARAQFHLTPRRENRSMVRNAGEEAPGDADVLALTMLTIPSQRVRCRRLLSELHDPFTADVAIARAAIDLKRNAEARLILQRVVARVPEWERPRHLLAELVVPVRRSRHL